jgi:hypothetical protein
LFFSAPVFKRIFILTICQFIWTPNQQTHGKNGQVQNEIQSYTVHTIVHGEHSCFGSQSGPPYSSPPQSLQVQG